MLLFYQKKNLWLEYFDQIKLLTIGPQTTKIKLLTIGPQTTKKCNKIFGRVDSQAQKYTFEGLLDIAINIFNQKNFLYSSFQLNL